MEAVKHVINKSTDFFYLFFIFFLCTGLCSYMYYVTGLKSSFSDAALIVFAGANLLYLLLLRCPSLIFLRDGPIQQFMKYLLFFFILGLITYSYSDHSQYAVNALRIFARVFFLFLSFVVLFSDRKRYQQAITLLVFIALFDVLMNIMTFINYDAIPLYDARNLSTHSFGRGGGYLINPNDAAFTIVFLMICGTESIPREYRVLFWLLCGIGVFVTFSRSGWIMWIIAILSMGYLNDMILFKKHIVPVVIGIGIWMIYLFGCYTLMPPVSIALANTALVKTAPANITSTSATVASTISTNTTQANANRVNSNNLMNQNTKNRLLLKSDYSINVRTNIALYSLKTFVQRPLLGYGLGYTRGWASPIGTHNIYLTYLVEGGVLFFLSYLFLLFLLWRSAYGIGRLLVLEISVLGVFNHNISESSIIWFVTAFILMHGFYHRHQDRSVIKYHE